VRVCVKRKETLEIWREWKKERETHNGGALRNGGAHFDLEISAAMIPC